MTVRLSEPSNPLSSIRRLWHALPKGHSLDGEVWSLRHRGIVWLLGVHAVGVPVFGLFTGR